MDYHAINSELVPFCGPYKSTVEVSAEVSIEDRANAHGGVELAQARRASQVSAAGP
jgi:hypothetical protein